MQKKRIQYLDSFGCDGNNYTTIIKKYIVDEWKNKMTGEFPDADEWSIEVYPKDCPIQNNTYDCGVFVCMFAHLLSLRLKLNFGQIHIDNFRYRIATTILKKNAM